MADKRRQLDGQSEDLAPGESERSSAAVPPAPVLRRFQTYLGNQAVQSMVEGREARPRRASPGPVIQKQTETSEAAAPVAAAPIFIVPDNAAELAAGQMRQGEFLEQLKAAVCQTAEDAVSGTIWTADGCPYIERWFSYYGAQESTHIENALHRFAPETRSAASAAEYIPVICTRVRQGLETWLETGRLDAREAEAGAEEGPSMGSGMLSGLQQMFFMADGSAPAEANPQAVQAELDRGQPLDSGVRRRMEGGFGLRLPDVRVHTGSRAGELSREMKARAFTVGEDIAFASGEYRPGTPVGDALIAHELAHVLQQDAGSGSLMTSPGGAANRELESDADQTAVQVILQLLGSGAAAGQAASLPQLKSGLRLSRCAPAETPEPEGIHYDRALGSCQSSPVFEGMEHTAYEGVEQDELLSHLETIDAGGVYIFYGHGAQERVGGPFVGINPASGHTVRGADLEASLSADESAPTMVVLAACGSAALLDNINNGGVPVAVGFSDSISNILAATALTTFMRELNNGSTLGEAQRAANDLIEGSNPILGGLGNGVEIRFLEGYDLGMTLQEARAKHRGE